MQVLPESQVSLGSLDRGMPEADLDLFERRAAEVGELDEGAPQIMRVIGPDPSGLRNVPQHPGEIRDESRPGAMIDQDHHYALSTPEAPS